VTVTKRHAGLAVDALSRDPQKPKLLRRNLGKPLVHNIPTANLNINISSFTQTHRIVLFLHLLHLLLLLLLFDFGSEDVTSTVLFTAVPQVLHPRTQSISGCPAYPLALPS
jgi:hypothetical protein